MRRQLSGDVDEIILKAMRKERAQRYATAEHIAEDCDATAPGSRSWPCKRDDAIEPSSSCAATHWA